MEPITQYSELGLLIKIVNDQRETIKLLQEALLKWTEAFLPSGYLGHVPYPTAPSYIPNWTLTSQNGQNYAGTGTNSISCKI